MGWGPHGKGAHFGGLKEEQQGNLTNEKEQMSGESVDSESELWNCKLIVQTHEACGKSFAGETSESSSSVEQESRKKYGNDMGPLCRMPQHSYGVERQHVR